jgi:hypothetical protein
MSRKPNEFIPATAPISQEHVVADSMTLNAVSLMDAQQSATVRAVAAQIGYQLPADCTDPDLIQRDISANMRRSVEACLEVGRGLAVLKAACEHGNFMSRLDVLGIDRKVSAKFMQAAAKFSNVSTSRHLTASLGNQSKLFEMLVLDDEQIEELELTGQTGDLHLDKIATMSVKELRAALREAKADAEATDRVLTDKEAQITKLQKASSKQIDAQEAWSGAMRELALHVAGHRANILESVTALDVIREKVMQQEAEPGAEAALAAAREQIGRELAEAVERAEELVSKVRRTFDVTLGALIN